MKKIRKGKRDYKPVIVAVIFVVLILAICFITHLIEKYTPSKTFADANAYFGFEGDLDSTGIMGMSKDNEVALIIDNEILEEKGVLVEDVVYVPEGVVEDYLNKRFYWDFNENILSYTTPNDIIRTGVASNEYSVGRSKQTVDYPIVKIDGSEACYVALDFVKMYSAMDYELYTKPNRVQIITEYGEKEVVLAKKDSAQIRRKGGIKSDILTELSGENVAVVLEELENWYKVRTEDGFIGYVKKKQVGDITTQKYTTDFVEPEYTNIQKNYTINLTWHQVTNKNANNRLSTLIADMKGVNTISPTWFSLADNEGNITSLASDVYVSLAHRCGMEVWGLVDNFKEGVSSLTVMSHTSKRERLVNQLMSEALEYDLDGLNIDFESIPPEAGEHFIQFIRELSTKCRANGIVLSIDNYVPGYTDYYNREEQGIVADYVIIMGYDEHSSASTESGSVASLPYVKQGIEDTLAEVPAEKVINAIPFYTRLWKETPKTQEEIAAEDASEAFVPYHLSSQSVGMYEIDKLVQVNGAELVWDDTAKQYYTEYVVDGSTYKMWIENETSIEEKMKLMKEYKLAGVASWKLGLEKDSIWDVIVKYTN